MTTDWRVKKIYELMSDPTTPGSAVHDEFLSIMNKWKTLPLTPFILIFWKGEWMDFEDAECLEPPSGRLEDLLLKEPVYFKVYSWGDSTTWCLSPHPSLESRVALFETCVPILFNVGNPDDPTEMKRGYGKIIPYEEEKVTRTWQDMIDKYEFHRQVKIFAEGFSDVWRKLSQDVEDWARMTNNEAMLDKLDDAMKEFLAKGE